jgi:hypothetical protein
MATGLTVGNQVSLPGGGGNSLGGNVVPAQGIYEQSATALHKLGDRLQLGDRVFYYSQASEALAVGKLNTQFPTVITEDTVTVAHPIGTRQVSITASATVVAQELAEGYLVVDEGTGAGEIYKIKSHPAITSGAVGVFTLYDPLLTAWATADTDVTIYGSHYRVRESNTAQTESAAGVSLISVTDEYYFWNQSYGPASVLFDEAAGNAAGTRGLTIGSSTVGAVEAIDAIGESFVGEVIQAAADEADAKYALVNLRIAI